MRTAAALTLLALAAGCAAGRPRPTPAPAGPAPRPFTSDGCSLFPDRRLVLRGDWCDCCLRHDVAYWRGGTEAEREAADQALRACVHERTGDPVLAGMMYAGVRAGGSPAFPTGFRWGYGWPEGRGYAPLGAEERAGAERMLAPFLARNPKLSCAAGKAEVTR
jgi:hypothetical protein